jgi:hypothetical protein
MLGRPRNDEYRVAADQFLVGAQAARKGTQLTIEIGLRTQERENVGGVADRRVTDFHVALLLNYFRPTRTTIGNAKWIAP